MGQIGTRVEMPFLVEESDIPESRFKGLNNEISFNLRAALAYNCSSHDLSELKEIHIECGEAVS